MKIIILWRVWTIGDLVNAEAKSSVEALVERGKPVRHIKISEINERSLGALAMHFILETIITAELIGVDPHNQPSVEYGKNLTREYLSKLQNGGKSIPVPSPRKKIKNDASHKASKE